MEPDPRGFQGTGRFRVLRRLGAGGMGVVYSASDAGRDEVIALKTLLYADPMAIYRLKKEFRALADVAHPNLVNLYELVSDGERWFFTMELVDGLNLLDYVRPGALDVARLRSTLPQVASGIIAIHDRGLLHRDLKPSNVLVTSEGRVVILDFGISADLAPDAPALRTVEEGIWGSAPYMAPEQVHGRACPASDWYALGVILYEALTGKLPFIGSALHILAVKQTEDPPRPDSVAPGVPVELADLCMNLMARDPEARPTGDRILHRLGCTPDAHPGAMVLPSRPDALVLGREQQLAELKRALARTRGHDAVSVYVHGASGIGKTTLVRRFLQLLSPRAGLVLAGRCYDRESVPFKALDGIIDSLSRYLRALPPKELQSLLEPEILTLSRLFPVLERVEAVAKLLRPARETGDPVELRRRAVAALRTLLRRIAAGRRLILHVDDLQWADADSVALFEELLSPPDPPALLFIATFRSEEIESHPFLQTVLAQARTPRNLEIRLGPLSDAETRRLARHLLGVKGAVARGQVESIVEESAGSPFLVEQLVHYVLGADGPGSARRSGVGLNDMLDARLARLPAGAREFMEVVAIAARPIDATIVREAAQLPGDERPLIARLRTEHLLRTSGAAGGVEATHDRIRENIASHLSPQRTAEIHRRLVEVMEARGVDEPETLFEHGAAAGLTERAGANAARAAQRASEALAFERAALFYKRALELLPSGAEALGLQVGLAAALANAGRSGQAADAYLMAASHAEQPQGLELRRRAAEQLLRSGHVDQGLAIVQNVLRAVGLRLANSPAHALVRLLARRAWIRLRGLRFRECPPEQLDPGLARRIDTVWGVAVGLARVDTIRASDFQSLNLLLSLRAGEPYRLARALAAEAAFVSLGGGASQHRAERLLAMAQQLAERVGNPHALGLVELVRGIARFYIGRFGDCRRGCELAEQQFRERCIGVMWEINTAHYYVLSSLYYLGELAHLARRAPARLREAQRLGDLYAAADVAAGRPIVAWLVPDDVAGARDAYRDAISQWSHTSFHLQHYLSLIAEGQLDLYTGDAERAWTRVSLRWPALKRSQLLRVQVIRVEALHLRARSALAAAQGRRGEWAQQVESAARDGRRIAAERMAWTRPLADLVLAGVQGIRGDEAGAALLMERAMSGFEAAGLVAFVMAAKRRLGALRGGEVGANLVADADGWFRSEGVAKPDRITAMLAPGFHD